MANAGVKKSTGYISQSHILKKILPEIVLILTPIGESSKPDSSRLWQISLNVSDQRRLEMKHFDCYLVAALKSAKNRSSCSREKHRTGPYTSD